MRFTGGHHGPRAARTADETRQQMTGLRVKGVPPSGRASGEYAGELRGATAFNVQRRLASWGCVLRLLLLMLVPALAVAQISGPPKPAPGSSLVLDVTVKTCTLTVKIPAAPATFTPSPLYRAQLLLDGKPYGVPRRTPATVQIVVPRGEDSFIGVTWSGGGAVEEPHRRFRCREDDYRLVTASISVQQAFTGLNAEQRGYLEGLWAAVHNSAAQVDAAVLAHQPPAFQTLLTHLAYFDAAWVQFSRPPLAASGKMAAQISVAPSPVLVVTQRVNGFHGLILRLEQFVRER